LTGGPRLVMGLVTVVILYLFEGNKTHSALKMNSTKLEY